MPDSTIRSAMTAASLRAGAAPPPWLPDMMTASPGRRRASCAAARARAAVDAVGVPSEATPPPSTTAISGKPARSPPSCVTRRSDLAERAVHDHQDREVVDSEGVLVDLVAVRLPALDALLVVHRVVPVALPERDHREQVVEGEDGLRDRVLLLVGIEAVAHLVDQGVEIDGALLERVLHAAARGGGVVRAQVLDERALRMRVANAPAHDRDLEVAGVHVGELLAADRAARRDLDAEVVERFLHVVGCAGPVGE